MDSVYTTAIQPIAKPSDTAVYSPDKFKILINSLEVISPDNRIISFRKKEFQLFLFLLAYKNQVINKHTLLELIWNYDLYAKTNTLEVHISNLRRKVDREIPHLQIQTVHGVGYRLIDRQIQ